MYLEISPRRSGKTHRLIEAVLTFVEGQLLSGKPGTAIIYSNSLTNSFAMKVGIIQMIRNKLASEGCQDLKKALSYSGNHFSLRFTAYSPCSPDVVIMLCEASDLSQLQKSGHASPPSSPFKRRFFDEFDFMDLPGTLEIYDSDYFCSSPKTTRKLDFKNFSLQIANDLLLFLWFHNQCTVKTYPYVSYVVGTNCCANPPTLTDEEFKTEILGEFIDITFEGLKHVLTLNMLANQSPVETPIPSRVTILSEKEYTPNARLILMSDIVLRHYPIKKSYYVIKNRTGRNKFWIYEDLLENFIRYPDGKLDWSPS